MKFDKYEYEQHAQTLSTETIDKILNEMNKMNGKKYDDDFMKNEMKIMNEKKQILIEIKNKRV